MDDGTVSRFWPKVDVRGPEDCWEWKASISRLSGYGKFRFHGRMDLAHRASYWISIGDPGDLCVLHRCDNRRCVNPGHFFLGTLGDNNRDRAEKGRSRDQNGERNNLAKLTAESIGAIRRNAEGLTGRALAKRFGVSPAAICLIRKGLRWSHVG